LQEEDLILHHGIPSKVVLFKFHRTFLWPARWVAQRSRPESNQRNTFAKPAVAAIRFPLHFSQAISFLLPFVLGAFTLSRIGFLDTFDPFDSSRAAVPGKLPSIGVT
jgi:hypothetical protein